MLVLTRKINESIMIGDDVEVVVVEVKGDQIKLGVRAPRSLSVHRAEVYNNMKEQNIQAASHTPQSLSALDQLLKKKDKK